MCVFHPRPVPSRPSFFSSSAMSFRKNLQGTGYSPIPWSQYFQECLNVCIPQETDDHRKPSVIRADQTDNQKKRSSDQSQPHNIFRVYRNRPSPSPPSSSSSSSTLPQEASDSESSNASICSCPNSNVESLFVLHHGAGHTALSWALVAQQIYEKTEKKADVIAFDMRGHGYTTTLDDSDYTLERLSNDLVDIVLALYPDQLPKEIILCGHSLGGAVVSHVAFNQHLKNVLGVAVLDVVEGTAIESLASMRGYLATRPNEFRSFEDSIQWSTRSGTIRNEESARCSVPSQLKLDESKGQIRYGWRTDLMKTQPFWEGWFINLSKKFLGSRCAKLLILAGTDRLDKELTIAQMQGKFQMVVLPACGHTVQEDAPELTSDHLVEFWKRNKRLVLPPKVGSFPSKQPTTI